MYYWKETKALGAAASDSWRTRVKISSTAYYEFIAEIVCTFCLSGKILGLDADFSKELGGGESEVYLY